jgi:hypothetical protein
MQGIIATGIKLLVAWRVAPFVPAAIGKMGGCISVLLDTEGLRRKVANLEAQVAAGGGGGGGGAVGAAPAAAEVLFFPDPAM